MRGSRPAATLLLDAKWGARRSPRAGAHGGGGPGTGGEAGLAPGPQPVPLSQALRGEARLSPGRPNAQPQSPAHGGCELPRGRGAHVLSPCGGERATCPTGRATRPACPAQAHARPSAKGRGRTEPARPDLRPVSHPRFVHTLPLHVHLTKNRGPSAKGRKRALSRHQMVCSRTRPRSFPRKSREGVEA